MNIQKKGCTNCWSAATRMWRGVALANKNARIVWALLANNREFRSDYTPAVAAA